MMSHPSRWQWLQAMQIPKGLDFIPIFGVVFGLNAIDALTSNRVLRFGGCVTVGLVFYPSPPVLEPPLCASCRFCLWERHTGPTPIGSPPRSRSCLRGRDD